MFQDLINEALETGRPYIKEGEVATYIPELGRADKNKLGISIFCRDGSRFSCGDTKDRFSIQSISKVISLAVALEVCGFDMVFENVGMEPSGDAFNSLIKLEGSNSHPYNPMINSGAIAVVEGVGDHGCEYMTGGRVVVLGQTGKNFAAGMSGGIAYVLDEDNDLYTRLNKEMVSSYEITSKYDVLELKDMMKEHVALTNSEKGKEILDNFGEYLPKFKKIIPHDYERMLRLIVQMEEKGLSAEQAQIEAFYANKGH